jgi:glycosyltransferase involved in cell wall biosynthesis
MNIHLAYPFVEGPFGGLNSFFVSLREEFRARECYAEQLDRADAVIFASFFFRALELYSELYAFKRRRPGVLYIHRMDGSIRITRDQESSRVYDEALIDWSRLVTDAAVFQSEFCRQQFYGQGFSTAIPSAVIGNAPNAVFCRPGGRAAPGPPWKIIYTSWSANPKKGFPTLEYLDSVLDFSRFEVTFAGNVPEAFAPKHIRVLPPLDHSALSDLLRAQHVFLGVSHHEPCSNATLEAMHCGLPALIRNSGGNPEFVRYGAALYDDDRQIPAMLDEICAGYAARCAALCPPAIASIADAYIDLARRIAAGKRPRKPSVFSYYRFRKKFTSVLPYSLKQVLTDTFGNKHV